MEATSGTDVVAVLTRDHREVEELFAQLEQLGAGEHDRRRALTEQAITELVRHSVAERPTCTLRPAGSSPQGDRLADRELAEHAQAERTMTELEGCSCDDARFDTLLRQLMEEIRQHVAEGEGELFPKLAAHASREELETLGSKVQAMKKVAPTRPHPAAPDTPPLDKLAAPGAGLVDRVRDALSGRGKE